MIGTSVQEKIRTHPPNSPRDALRFELEATLASFQAALDALREGEWRNKSPSSAWTVGQIFVHLTWAIEYLPKEVESARRGKGMFNLPKPLADPLSYWYIRWISRSATKESLGRRYEKAMRATIHLLDKIPEEDWNRGADFYGEGFHTVEDLFHVPAQHLEEHTGGMQPARTDGRAS